MIWFVAEDSAYYTDYNSLCEKYQVSEIITFPTQQEIKSIFPSLM